MNPHYIPPCRSVLLASAAILASAILASAIFCMPAAAATIVGYPVAGAVPEAWGPGYVIAQRRNLDDAGTPYAGFSAGGVLTSISVKTSGTTGNIAVSVLRKTADVTPDTSNFLSLADINVPVSADDSVEGHATTVATRLAVNAGDRFGATTPSSGTRYLRVFSDAESDFCFYKLSPHAPGESTDYSSNSCNNFIPLVEGTIEPDVDNDLFGDETQDSCPTDPTRRGACAIANLSVTAVKSKARTRTSAQRTFKITNVGDLTSGAFNFRIKAAKSPSKLSIVKGCTPTRGTKKRACMISGLAPGASATVRVSWTPKAALKVALTGSVIPTTPESAGTDNSARTTVRARRPK